MRLHEIIDACVEYVAIEGTLGADIDTLRNHLTSLDRSLDETYFDYVYRHLIDHPSIQVILTAHPLPPVSGEVRVGTAPVPEDAVTESLAERDEKGFEEIEHDPDIRGRRLAFQLAGKEYRSSKEVIQDKREERRQAQILAKEKKVAGSEPPAEEVPEDQLCTVLDEDDGGDGDDRVSRTDLQRLLAKWGSRLRIRATDDEMYYRLVGTTEKNPKITAVVFLILQTTAKAREKGITTIELGPATGTSQGSLHYYMKVLTGLGLCARLPTVSFAAQTNLIVFHRFLKDNPTYQSLVNTRPTITPTEPLFLQEDNDDDAGVIIPENEVAEGDDDPVMINDWGLDFSPLSEQDVLAGHIIKDRLLLLLDHPNLKNHLLKARLLLPLLGWHGGYIPRMKRALTKHTRALILAGVIEKVLVGDHRIACLRLTKHNPDPLASNAVASITVKDRDIDPALAPSEDVSDAELVSRHAQPFTYTGGASLATHLEYQVNRLIVDSREAGMTIAEIRDQVSTYYKRSVELLQIKLDNAHVPPTLAHFSVTSIMENLGRERRIRLYSVSAMRKVLMSQNSPLDDAKFPPTPPEAGHWQDVSTRHLFATIEELYKLLDKMLSTKTSISSVPTAPPDGTVGRTALRAKGKTKAKVAKSSKAPKQPKQPKQPKVKAPRKAQSAVPDSDDEPAKPREMKYNIESQVRGRPRKYIHVVDETGKVRRHIIGEVYPHPDLAPIYVWIERLNKLVVPPPSYHGIGKPPPLDPKAIEEGLNPSVFRAYDQDTRKQKKMRKQLAARDGEAAMASVEPEAEGSKKGKGKKRGRPAKSAQQADGGPSSGREAPKKKKQKKATNEDAETPVDASTLADVVPVDSIDPNLLDPDHQNIDPRLTVEPQTRRSDGAEMFEQGSAGPSRHPDLGPSSHHSPVLADEPVSGADAPMPKKVGRPKGSKSKTKATKEEPTSPIQTLKKIGKRKRDPGTATGTDTDAPTPGTTGQSDSARPSDEGNGRTSGAAKGKQKAKKDGPSRPKTPRQRSPSPMIGSDFSSERPLFSIPNSEPRGQTFVLPQVVRAFKTRMEKKAAADGSTSDIGETPASDGEAPPAGMMSVPPSPTTKKSKRTPRETASDVHDSAPKGSSVPVVTEEPSTQQTRTAIPLPDGSLATTETDSQAVEMMQQEDILMTDDQALPVSDAQGKSPRPRKGAAPKAKRVADLLPPTPVTAELPTGPTASFEENTSSSPFAVPSTPSRAVGPAVDGRDRDGETPSLREMTPSSVKGELEDRRYGRHRIDFAAMRRENEICEVLREEGGVVTNHKLRFAHNTWAIRVAGTDTPFAPQKAYQMDRSVFTKAIDHMKNEGRIKETITTIPNTTGRWVKTGVIYLSDTPWHTVQKYIRAQSDSIVQASTPRRKFSHNIAATDFSDLRSPSTINTPEKKTSSADPNRRRSILGQQPVNSPLRTEVAPGVTPTQRREALLHDAEVTARLYGYNSARNRRCQILHKALVRVMTSRPSPRSVVSTDPQVFALPLLIEELTAVEWFATMRIGTYEPEMERFLSDPANKDVRLQDVPKDVLPFKLAAIGSKARYWGYLESLKVLNLLEPLVMSQEGDHTLVCDDRELGGKQYLKRADDVKQAIYYRLYEFAPVYHVAAEIPGLLGVLPLQTPDQVDHYWSTLKDASLLNHLSHLPRIQPVGRDAWNKAAKVEEVGTFSVAQRQFLTSSRRWKADFRFHPTQQEAFDHWVDQHPSPFEGEATMLDDMSYEYAVPRSILEEYIGHRRQVLKFRSEKVQNRTAQVKAAKRSVREKREETKRAAEESLKQKLAERAERKKVEWETRVKTAADATNTPFNDELLSFVARHAIQTSTIDRAGAVTEAALKEACKIYQRFKRIGTGAAPEQTRPVKAVLAAVRAPAKSPAAIRKKQKRDEARAALNLEFPAATAYADIPTSSDGIRRRRRRNWSQEDLDLLLDCEAIIRARSRDVGNARGRLAMNQILPNVAPQTMLSRIKRQLALPGKQAYFDRLVDTWYEIWKQRRGTEELPDPDPESITNFDLKVHLEYFRAHIHKPSIRLAAAANPTDKTKQAKVPDLPPDLATLYADNTWTYQDVPPATFEPLWNPNGGEDVRLAMLSSTSLTDLPVTSYNANDERTSLHDRKLYAIMKMIVGTPTVSYFQPAAKNLLDQYTNQDILRLSQAKCDERVFRKTANLSENARQYAFTSTWLSAREGYYPLELYNESAKMESVLRTDDVEPSWQPWSLLASGGDVAAVLDAASKDQVDFQFDIAEFPTIIDSPDGYNTRHMNDIDFEFDLKIRGKVPPKGASREHEAVADAPPPLVPWSKEFNQPLEPADLPALIVTAVKAAGPPGLTKKQIQDRMRVNTRTFSHALSLLATQDPAQVFWTGYDAPRLVHRSSWKVWTVETRNAVIGPDRRVSDVEEKIVNVMPRQWIDIYGQRMDKEWQTVCGTVLGHVITRAGISETALREKVSVVLDRLETNDALQNLIDRGQCRRKVVADAGEDFIMPPIEATDEKEGEMISWFPIVGDCWM